VSVESRGSVILKNYLAMSGGFLAFAVLVVFSRMVVDSEIYSYVSAVIILGLTCILLRALRVRALRGFLPYCFAFVLCTAVFPVSDALGNAFPDFVLYVGFVGMLIVIAVMLRRAATYTGELG
jgi:hypothetical protein